MHNTLMEQVYGAQEFIRHAWRDSPGRAEAALEAIPSSIEKIFLTGCGDSHYAALGLEVPFQLWSGCQVRSGPAMQVGRYLIPHLSGRIEKTMVVGISSSGEVARTIEAVELASQAGARTLAITSSSNSTLAGTADACISIAGTTSSGPGLLGYLASLLMGFALCAKLSDEAGRAAIEGGVETIMGDFDQWCLQEQSKGIRFAEEMQDREACIFVGAGPAYGSACFSAAKAIEAAGVPAWGQELEEWAHLEYFCEPSGMPTWILTTKGRAADREQEVIEAAKAIGRHLVVSRCTVWEGLPIWVREALSPLALWVGPSAFAAALADRLGEQPFRGFRGGRSAREGGGASRIRTSKRVHIADLSSGARRSRNER
jgi:glucosamine--fructose-6-phosphate aminotransferase (isomerizing)